MRTKFLFFAMLASIAASATVTVTPLSTDYDAKKVTFNVVWTNSPTAPYNNRVWIWIDFCPVNGITPQSFSTATITSPTKTGGNGTITGLNGRGFFIEYSAINAGTTVTATLSNAPTGKVNWCAYGSDYPPSVTLDKGSYTFKGTTNFIVSNHAQPITTKTVARTSLTVNSSSTFTDATGCPGIGGLYCPYTGGDLIVDVSHLCQQRTSGAKNWEAWIKDSRDNELYRIVLMPDQKWYMAQNLNYRGVTYYCYGDNSSNCNKTNGVWYRKTNLTTSLCPTGWLVPSGVEWSNFVSGLNLTNADVKSTTHAGNDTYGLSAMCVGLHASCCGNWLLQNQREVWWSSAASDSGLHIYNSGTWTLYYGCVHDNCSQYATDAFNVRCFRQL
jgi:uncharacterized protein (TIGR02145 family)